MFASRVELTEGPRNVVTMGLLMVGDGSGGKPKMGYFSPTSQCFWWANLGCDNFDYMNRLVKAAVNSEWLLD